jgi:hypothetical protein
MTENSSVCTSRALNTRLYYHIGLVPDSYLLQHVSFQSTESLCNLFRIMGVHHHPNSVLCVIA